MQRRTLVKMAGAAGVGLAAPWAKADAIVLKYGWHGPATEPTYQNSMEPFGKAVTADSSGTVKVQMFPGGTLGKDPSGQVKYLQDGVLDIVFLIPSYTPGRFPDNGVFELPGLYNNATEASLAMWRMFQKGMLRGYEDLHVLQLATTYPNLIHTREPLKSIDELKGKKLRVSGPVAGDTVRALGAVPVGLPVTQAAESISRGVVDGTVQDWNTYAAFRLTDAAKQHLAVPLGQAPMLVAMTKARHDSLPEPAKAALARHGGEKLVREVGGLHDRITAQWRERVKTERGHVVTTLSDADMKAFQSRVQPVIEAWAGAHPRGKELLAVVQQELVAIRAGK
jgi:TRAP-type C4-dicarboxylate transport system substrate-binding protein